MSTRDGVATPRMRAQLRLLAVLAGFVVLVVAIAFVAAFRNTATNDAPGSLVRLDAVNLRDGSFVTAHATRNVMLAGVQEHEVDLFVVRTGGELHALWARSPQLGCTVKPIGELNLAHTDDVAFGDPCGGSLFAIDGRCVDGPCPRGLDEFAIVQRSGGVYADLAHLQRGPAREPAGIGHSPSRSGG